MKRTALVIALSLLGAAAWMVPHSAQAQPTGEFVCSGGPNDGQACEAFSECLPGACIFVQGVCADGQICVCPGGGVCFSTPVCAFDARFGTCDGGVADGACCDANFNCPANDTCIATHRLCLNGSLQGFPCINDQQCDGGVCGSNGFFCDGGSADGFGCVTDEDCPDGGSCVTFDVPATPTNTPVTPGATAPPATPTQPGSTPVPTNTQRPFPTVPTGVVPPTPTSPPANTATPVTPTPTLTPIVGTLVTTIGAAEAGANKISVNVDPQQFPVQGVVDVGGGTLIDFTRRRSSTVLDLKAPNGLPFGLEEGSVVRVVEYTPTPGPVIIIDERIEEGDGCAIRARTDESSSGAFWLLGLGFALLLLRKRS